MTGFWIVFCGLTSLAHAEPRVSIETLATGLQAPFAIEALPDGHLLVTEKPGNLLRLNPETGERLTLHRFNGIVHRGQGGLLDVALHPEFDQTPDVFLTGVQRSPRDPDEVGVVVWRARLGKDALVNPRIIWRQPDTARTVGHFGSRMVFIRSGGTWTLLLTLGEQQRETPAQDPKLTAGKIVALTLDGAPAQARSPVVGALPEIATRGHRNPQGIDVHPETGQVWLVEHGPQGGDELNAFRPGANYGWPAVSYGCPYGSVVNSACEIGGGVHAPQFEEPAMRWTPVSTAPSSLRFYRGAEFADMSHDALMTALAGRGLWRIRFSPKGEPVGRDKWLGELKLRLRDSALDARGRILLISDDGQLLRIGRMP